MRAPYMVFVMSVTTAPLLAQIATTPRARAIAADVDVLAADSLQGRKTCQPGNETAARYLAGQLARSGVRPAGDSGTWFEHWSPGNTAGNRQAGIVGCTTANVVGMIPGRGALAGQYLVIGAHFDHLGTGGFGSLAPDSGQVHNGADDNASGTAAVLELARLLRARAGPGPRRTVVLGLWSGEEEGSLGSAYYAQHLPMARDSVLAYLNFDMVGRLRDGKLLVLGVRTATEWRPCSIP